MKYILILFSFILFLYAIRKNKPVIIFYLIVQGIWIDIISIQAGANISIMKIIGIYYFVHFLLKYRSMSEFKIPKYFGIIFIYLILSLIYFNFISSWESEYHNKQYLLISSLKQIFTFSSEFGCIYFLANYFIKIKNYLKITQGILIIVYIFFAGIFLEKILNFDFFHTFTGGPQMLISHRVRGFNFEPRAASYYCSIILTSLLLFKFNILQRSILLLSSGLALVLTNSMTGFVILISSITIITSAAFLLKARFLKYLLTSIILATTLIGFFLSTNYSKLVKNHLKTKSYIINSSSIVNRLEFADSAALNFFIDNPKFLLFGVGVGQATAATSKYLTPSKIEIWPEGLTYLPFMGIFLLLVNGGLILFITYILIIIYGLRKLYKMNVDKDQRDLLFTFTCLLLGTYFIQVRYFHIIGFSILLYSEIYNKKELKA